MASSNAPDCDDPILPLAVDAEGYLLCPWCRGVFTHHQRVAIHQREPFEDGDSHATVVATASDGDDLAGAPDVPGNPSSRRNGITVDLYCELCAGWFALRIAQHKGQTIVDVMKTQAGSTGGQP